MRILRRDIPGTILAAPLLTLVLAGPAAGGGDAAAKIRFDLSRLDEDGLYGPPDGLRSLSYEFCIPRDGAASAEVRRIDPTLAVYPSRGRVGCTASQLLAIGDTHQPGYRRILMDLARLPYVTRIEQAFFE